MIFIEIVSHIANFNRDNINLKLLNKTINEYIGKEEENDVWKIIYLKYFEKENIKLPKDLNSLEFKSGGLPKDLNSLEFKSGGLPKDLNSLEFKSGGLPPLT